MKPYAPDQEEEERLIPTPVVEEPRRRKNPIRTTRMKTRQREEETTTTSVQEIKESMNNISLKLQKQNANLMTDSELETKLSQTLNEYAKSVDFYYNFAINIIMIIVLFFLLFVISFWYLPHTYTLILNVILIVMFVVHVQIYYNFLVVSKKFSNFQVENLTVPPE